MNTTSSYLIQNIINCYKDQLLAKPMPLKHIKAVEAISSCRTAVCGVSVYECGDRLTETHIAHSCRHRSCWLCASRRRYQWGEQQQQQRLLDCPHFHCVFTLPHEYHGLWQYNQRWFTSTFFDVVRGTLMDLLKKKSEQGLMPGILMAMHTWGRQLVLHPHIHCVVTGGGMDDRGQWVNTGKYLLAARQVRALRLGVASKIFSLGALASSKHFVFDLLSHFRIQYIFLILVVLAIALYKQKHFVAGILVVCISVHVFDVYRALNSWDSQIGVNEYGMV